MEAPKDIEVSEREIGQVITIGCRVTTCGQTAEIVLAKGFDILNKVDLVSDATNVVLNTKLVLSDNTMGSYQCRVSQNGVLYQTFFSITRQPPGNYENYAVCKIHTQQ